MNSIQQVLIAFWGTLALIGFVKSFYECAERKNPYGLTYIFRIYGAFVWADLVVFGIFWTLISLLALVLNSWYLFLLAVSLFWLVRSIGETIYWFNQQFSTLNKNPINRFLMKRIFHNDSIWFVYQIFWQCMTVLFTISTIFLASKWLQTI
jgi:hypothetical protein